MNIKKEDGINPVAWVYDSCREDQIGHIPLLEDEVSAPKRMNLEMPQLNIVKTNVIILFLVDNNAFYGLKNGILGFVLVIFV